MREIRDLLFARRWGVARQIHAQSVAEHSFFTAVYAAQLARMCEYPEHLVGELLHFALMHDAAEQFLTDIPGPVKRAVCDPAKLAAYEQAGMLERFGPDVPLAAGDSFAKDIVKLADMIDEICHLLGEQRLGNTNLKRLLEASHKRLDQAVLKLSAHLKLNLAARVRNFVDRTLYSEDQEDSLEPK